MVLVSRSNRRTLRKGDQRALRQLKSEIDILKDKFIFIKHTYSGSTQDKWYLILVNIDQSDPVAIMGFTDVGVILDTVRNAPSTVK